MEARKELMGAYVPHAPVDTHIWLYTERPPKWLGPLAVSIANGGGEPWSINGSTIDVDGNLILYRRLSPEDHERFPDLADVEEVWLTYRMRWEGE